MADEIQQPPQPQSAEANSASQSTAPARERKALTVREGGSKEVANHGAS